MRFTEIVEGRKRRRKKTKKTILPRGVYGYIGYPLDGDGGGGDGGMAESMEINPTRVSVGCEVYEVSSADQLGGLINRYDTLRGMLHWDGSLVVWEADKATHHAYELTFGDDGARRLMFFKRGMEYNSMDFDTAEEAIKTLCGVRSIKRLYGDDFVPICNDF